MILRSLLRLAGAALVTAGIGAAGLACPARDLVVAITSDGTSTIALACESFRDACKGKACSHNRLLCDQTTCTLKDACQLDSAAEWAPGEVMGVQLLLLTAGKGGLALQSRSPCVPLNLRPCIADPTGLVGCPDADPNAGQCLTDALARAVLRALGSGFTFDGFTNPEDVLLTAAFFQKPGHAVSCDPAVLVGPDDCAVQNLVAAAGFAAPLGGTAYDITCASCQGSTHASLGSDNAPCPVTDDACFLQQLAALLAADGN